MSYCLLYVVLYHVAYNMLSYIKLSLSSPLFMRRMTSTGTHSLGSSAIWKGMMIPMEGTLEQVRCKMKWRLGYTGKRTLCCSCRCTATSNVWSKAFRRKVERMVSRSSSIYSTSYCSLSWKRTRTRSSGRYSMVKCTECVLNRSAVRMLAVRWLITLFLLPSHFL
jgi:hypothetical protein